MPLFISLVISLPNNGQEGKMQQDLLLETTQAKLGIFNRLKLY